MSYFLITGNQKLFGKLTVQGAKNSVLPILAATVLANGACVIQNCPDLSDVDSALRILRHLGCKATRESGAVAVDTAGMNRYDIPERLMREMRSSVVFMGAILGRCGQVSISTPGGCDLGIRPIELHLESLRALGTDIVEEHGRIEGKTAGLVGREINLSFPSVGATENSLLAACAARGVTTVTNAACEPEIADLAAFLNKLGARITGAGSSVVTVERGVTKRGAEHAIIPDRIAAATFMSAVAAAGGDVLLENVRGGDVNTVSAALMAAGCRVETGENTLRVARNEPLSAVSLIRTMPYPGFPTDAQPPVMAALACAQGTSVFIESIFDSRYRHVSELLRLGADITVESRVAVVRGVNRLCGAAVNATDLRGGAALTVAALAAEGETKIGGLHHIDRGYDGLAHSLSLLGANIRRIEE